MFRAQTTALLVAVSCLSSAFSQTNFVNFETAPVNPIALSPDGKTLAICNLAAARIEFFDVSTGLQRLGMVPVGLDPVTVRFWNAEEAWVVNTISDSINVVDVRSFTLKRVISTRDAPADVVFAGNPLRAYVSCSGENIVQVIHPDSGAIERTLSIQGERPKALAVSSDGRKVYTAILESGNRTTIIAPQLTGLGHVPPGGPVDIPLGPHAGMNPPPNAGTNFNPEISAKLTNAPPRVGMIVKKHPNGRWLDDNEGDWTELVSGTNAPLTGRIQGWDLLDHDIAVIDTASFQITYITGLMNICFNLAVNPADGELALAGTDALNHVRYEPALQSIFTRVQLGLVGATTRVVDLNPHLDYKIRTLPLSQRSASVGDPRAIVWNANGTRLYVAGMGSDNIVILSNSGERIRPPVAVPAGPVGLVFDAQRNRVYVLSRFEATLTSLDAETLLQVDSTRLFDPTPAFIQTGRKHFYNTHKSSGLGQASCASCHIDGKFDRLAWDLGTPTGEMKFISNTNYNFGANAPSVTNHFHPMKGPMVTQTLQDIIGHEPFHWRGDRNGLEEFNPTFEELQGADELTELEMQEFEDFLASMHFPPNRFRTFENALPRALPIPGHLALGRGVLRKNQRLPNGDAAAGLATFRSFQGSCNRCHSLPSGLGPDRFFQAGSWRTIPPGPDNERHVALAAVERSHLLPFKIPHLRNLQEKVGFTLEARGTVGFGFFHDGGVDTLTRFLQEGFGFTDDKQTADMIAFLLAFGGSDLPTTTSATDPNVVPGQSSRDVAASVGRQVLVSSDLGEINALITRATSTTGRVDLIVKARIAGVTRGWIYNRTTAKFRRDSIIAEQTRAELFAVPKEGQFAFLLVPRGSGVRLGIDEDEDGELDFDELQRGLSEPQQGHLQPVIRLAKTVAGEQHLACTWEAPPGLAYRILTARNLQSDDWTILAEGTTESWTTISALPVNGEASEAYFRIELLSE